MWSVHGQNVTDRRLFVSLVAALIALTWLSLWAWGESPYGRYLSHHSLEEVRGNALLVPVFLAGWTLMVVAMMLPTSLPLVMLFRALTRQRLDRPQLLALLVAGYLLVWVGFGLLVYLSDWFLHAAVAQSAWLEAHAWLIGAGTLVLAGVYQFTPLKHFCLDKCRSPLGFVMSHWRGRAERRQALLLGAHHGMFCLGCCWSLMLLMFAVGVGNLAWMFALGVVMAIEKNLPWGRKFSAPLGFGLIGWGFASALLAV